MEKGNRKVGWKGGRAGKGEVQNERTRKEEKGERNKSGDSGGEQRRGEKNTKSKRNQRKKCECGSRAPTQAHAQSL